MKTPALAALLALLASASFAQQGQPGGHLVSNWDANNDSAVSLEEATTRRAYVFTTFDQNDDGILNAEEYDAFDEARREDMANEGGAGGHGNGPMKRVLQSMLRETTDVNADGQVTREEFLETVPAWFASMDTNGDGSVTTEDFGKGH